jgi:hypothetical protein
MDFVNVFDLNIMFLDDFFATFSAVLKSRKNSAFLPTDVGTLANFETKCAQNGTTNIFLQ